MHYKDRQLTLGWAYRVAGCSKTGVKHRLCRVELVWSEGSIRCRWISGKTVLKNEYADAISVQHWAIPEKLADTKAPGALFWATLDLDGQFYINNRLCAAYKMEGAAACVPQFKERLESMAFELWQEICNKYDELVVLESEKADAYCNRIADNYVAEAERLRKTAADLDKKTKKLRR